MTAQPDTIPAAPVAASDAVPGPRRTLRVFQVVTVLHTLTFLGQPLLAGMYLGGDVDAIVVHQVNAFAVAGFDLIQLGCAIAYGWAGRGRWWPTWATLVIALLVEVQVGFGYERMLGVHVPLGVSLLLAQTLLTIWLFGPKAAMARPVRRAKQEAS